MCSENKNEKLKELLDYVRGDYNVFYVLGVDHKENYHSRMIADLLNPKGHHQLGSMPLNKFCNIVNIKPLKPKYLYVKTEKYTDENRRMDIYIGEDFNEKENGEVVVIENKIDAGDQNLQLQDYHKDVDRNGTPQEKIHLFYLTLDGSPPSKESAGDLEINKHFESLSYKQHIIPWLESILASSQVYINNPLLSSVLLQYKNTVEYLVNPDELLEKIAEATDEECNRGVIINHLYDKFSSKIGERFLVIENQKYIQIKSGVSLDGVDLYFCILCQDPMLLWLCLGEETKMTEEQRNALTKKFEDTLLVDDKEPTHLTWRLDKITYNNTLASINTLEELKPEDFKFLLSSEDVHSTNFEQIIHTLQKYIVKLKQLEQFKNTQVE